MCDHNENDNSEIIEINEQDNFKFSLDSLPNKPPSPSPLNSSSLSMTTSNLRFGLQEDLGKIFALQGINNNNVTFDNNEQQIEQHSHNYYRKIIRPTPPSLNTNLLLIPDDISSHRRRDSNVSAMSIQLHDIGSSHQRRDSNVSNMSMQLDTPTPSSGTESGNEDENRLAYFPFTFSQKSFTRSRPSTPTPTTPPHSTNFYSAPSARASMSSLINPPPRIRRMSLDISMESGYLNGSSEGRNEKTTPMHRAVKARRASLLPKTKSFQRVANELQEESRPIETEIKQEYKTTKVLKNEFDSMDIGKLPEYRQDTPSPTSTVGPLSTCSRIKRKASDDRFEPYFNPKRRAVSPSLVGSPPVISGISSPSTTNCSSPSYSSGVTVSPNCHISTTSRGQVKGNNSNLSSIHDANGSFSRLNLNGE
ncbi:1924_t:CDS:2 [Diversispora eburnea]|uniref:1924_t:CDS:1 n=1 Tax=Diversispora eburnea TaxID=1213867 RepID=A0A9N9F396_9GLOM|nr:1924_t:CDS:2 [Diversispora eburnea]